MTPDTRAALEAIRDLCDLSLNEMRERHGSEQRVLMAVIPGIVGAALQGDADAPKPAPFFAADRALAVAHREDDQPCGCDECMSYGADDAGFDWYKVAPARRIVLRALDSGDDRFAPLVTAFREHEDADAPVGGLTPLQREVEPPPSCSRCKRPISALSDLYRCAQCHAAFHHGCITEHFGWSVSGPGDMEKASHDRAAASSADAGAGGLAEARREIEGLTSWPRVSMFAYDALIRGVPVNPTEDRVVIDRDAALAIIDRLLAAATGGLAGEDEP